MHRQLAQRGGGQAELQATEEILDPEALTIGFARRFATYKRANLLLRDPQRLARLLTRPGQKVQILFAGKAHPRDNPGKELIRQIVHIARTEPFTRSLVFLEDYDMHVARYLVQGVDVWLNTPLRPMEASGTSGMKVAANGGLNVSIPDGWWAEGYDPTAGWAIGAGEEYDDLDYQNTVESQALYDLLEKEIIPTFYNRGPDDVPRLWVNRMKAAICRLAPVFNTNRMVRQYAERFYVPASRNFDDLTADNLARAREQNAWKKKLTDAFGDVRIESVKDNMNGLGVRVGQPIRVEVVVNLGRLEETDVAVELYAGRLDDDGQLSHGEIVPMDRIDRETDNRVRYAANMPCSHSGMTGYTVRVIPGRGEVTDTRVSALIHWA
jgi:starch phosphorylase